MGRLIVQVFWVLFVMVVLFVMAFGLGELAMAAGLFCVLICLGAIEDHLNEIAKNTWAIRARIAPPRKKRRGSGEATIAVISGLALLAAILGMWWLWHDQPELLDTLLGR